LFVFDRLQVIADVMEGWNDANSSSSNGSSSKKRGFEMGTSGDRVFKRHAVVLDEEIDDL